MVAKHCCCVTPREHTQYIHISSWSFSIFDLFLDFLEQQLEKPYGEIRRHCSSSTQYSSTHAYVRNLTRVGVAGVRKFCSQFLAFIGGRLPQLEREMKCEIHCLFSFSSFLTSISTVFPLYCTLKINQSKLCYTGGN